MKRVVITALLVGCSGEVTSTSDVDSGTGSGSMAKIDASIPGGVGEPANLTGITLYHNQVRAAVQTTTPLPPMQWDPNLAAYAAQWAAMCKDGGDSVNGLIDHDPNRTNVAGYDVIGENIFGAGGTATAKGAVDSWASEAVNFTYPNTCNGICGHYTQIVWRTSVHLGCALQVCPGLQYGNTIVCDYGPAGNSGGAPY
ncbi:MAG TPA: CAP domain-containing protein [Kofleriaceae bacterium]